MKTDAWSKHICRMVLCTSKVCWVSIPAAAGHTLGLNVCHRTWEMRCVSVTRWHSPADGNLPPQWRSTSQLNSHEQ